MSLGRKDTVAARISKYLEVAPPSDAAQASDVLLGKQFITTGYAFQTGAMPDNGDLGTITPTTTGQPIPIGYTLGGTVAGDADLLPANIIDGVTIFGVLGTGGVPTGTAQPSEVLIGDTFMNAGGPQTGTMPNNGSLGTITPTTTNQSIPAGFTTGGTVAGSPNLLPGNIRISTNIFGVIGTLDPGTQTGGTAVSADVLTGKTFTNDIGQQTGSMVARTGDTAALSSSVSGTTLKLLASGGYRNGTTDNVTITDADFVASNIKTGVNLFGLAGSFGGGSNITSIQTGQTSIASGSASTTATITAVDTTKSVVSISYISNGQVANSSIKLSAEVTNATTLTFVRGSGSGGSAITINWTVVEFANVNSNQKGSLTLSNLTANNVTVTSVATTKSLLFMSFSTTASGTLQNVSGFIANATTLTFQTDLQPVTVKWQLIEFT